MTGAPNDPRECHSFEARLHDCLSDRLSPEDQRAFWRHTGSCPSCLELVMAKDPSHLFGVLSLEENGEPLPGGEEFWRGFWPAIEEGIRSAPAGSAPRPARRAAVAVLAVAAGLAGLLLILPRLTQQAPAPAPDAPPIAASVPAAAPPIFQAAGGPWPPTVEQVRTDPSRDVQVYSMTYYQPSSPDAPAGQAQQATDLILIVDAGLDL
ncbi:MAG TPA: hypothetical protein VFG76_06135 [Candidatus Polarisedimenticolia bacterium]|nr:hypothetical protein [Candidatus Polarisedimenticolia bacterium]